MLAIIKSGCMEDLSIQHLKYYLDNVVSTHSSIVSRTFMGLHAILYVLLSQTAVVCVLDLQLLGILISQVQNELPDSIIRQELDSVKAGVCML
ncbi:MAG: hypothetical protein Q9206_001797 [Seirophora lacunosa]